MNYDYSRPFSNTLYSENNIIDIIVDRLRQEIARTGKINRWHTRHATHLKLILCNLIYASAYDRELYLSYSRMKNTYSETPQQQNSIVMRYEAMIMLIDILWHDLNYVEGCLGFHDREGKGRSRSARMRATAKLLDFVERVETKLLLNVDDYIQPRYAPDRIVLKDKNKKVIKEFSETDQVKQMRQRLITINQMINSHFIGLCIKDEDLPKLKYVMKNRNTGESEDKYRLLDFSRTWLYRSFNNSSFEQGGRFYGGWWQEIPSAYRKHIRIDGMSVEEVDFSGMHVMLLYAIEGLDLPVDDVYTIENITELSRATSKIILQILLNTRKPSGAHVAAYNNPDIILPYKPIACEECETNSADCGGYKTCEENREMFDIGEIFKAFEEKHSGIAKYFYKGSGSKIQFYDSQIAEAVMLRLIEKEIPVLPVHDSFIVPRSFREELEQAMADVTKEMYGQAFIFKKDPSAYEEDFQFYNELLPDEDMQKFHVDYESVWTSKDCGEYINGLKKWKKSQNRI